LLSVTYNLFFHEDSALGRQLDELSVSLATRHLCHTIVLLFCVIGEYIDDDGGGGALCVQRSPTACCTAR